MLSEMDGVNDNKVRWGDMSRVWWVVVQGVHGVVIDGARCVGDGVVGAGCATGSVRCVQGAVVDGALFPGCGG